MPNRASSAVFRPPGTSPWLGLGSFWVLIRVPTPQTWWPPQRPPNEWGTKQHRARLTRGCERQRARKERGRGQNDTRRDQGTRRGTSGHPETKSQGKQKPGNERARCCILSSRRPCYSSRARGSACCGCAGVSAGRARAVQPICLLHLPKAAPQSRGRRRRLCGARAVVRALARRRGLLSLGIGGAVLSC